MDCEVDKDVKNIKDVKDDKDKQFENKATIEFLSNPMYLGILKKKKELVNEYDNNDDVKFYKKRIISLFKDIIKGGECTNELKNIHNKFIYASIRYFEMNDKKDILQKQYAGEGAIEGAGADEDALVNDDACDIDIDVDIDVGDENMPLEKANKLMMKKSITFTNLDNFVINNHDNSSNDLRIIPLKVDIDLKSPELKKKGIRKKKKYVLTLPKIDEIN